MTNNTESHARIYLEAMDRFLVDTLERIDNPVQKIGGNMAYHWNPCADELAKAYGYAVSGQTRPLIKNLKRRNDPKIKRAEMFASAIDEGFKGIKRELNSKGIFPLDAKAKVHLARRLKGLKRLSEILSKEVQ
jgi:hypothetical protein